MNDMLGKGGNGWLPAQQKCTFYKLLTQNFMQILL